MVENLADRSAAQNLQDWHVGLQTLDKPCTNFDSDEGIDTEFVHVQAENCLVRATLSGMNLKEVLKLEQKAI